MVRRRGVRTTFAPHFSEFFGRAALDPHIFHVRVKGAKAFVACSVCSGSPHQGQVVGKINAFPYCLRFEPETCGVVFRCSAGFAGVRSAWFPIWLPKVTRIIGGVVPEVRKER